MTGTNFISTFSGFLLLNRLLPKCNDSNKKPKRPFSIFSKKLQLCQCRIRQKEQRRTKDAQRGTYMVKGQIVTLPGGQT